MKNLKGITGNLITLLIVAVLGGGAILFFSQQAQKMQNKPNLAQLEAETSIKPTPLTPIPTIPPKPSPTGSRVKPTPITPIPTIPPKSSLTSLESGTSTPIILSQTPTPVYLPTNALVLPEELPLGLKFVYAETDAPDGTSMIWMASAISPTHRSLLITISHKEGHRVRGTVSPDGKNIAYLVIPPEASEKNARKNAGELWIMNLDSMVFYKAAEEVGYLAMWSPDSHNLIFGRWISPEKINNLQLILQMDVYMLADEGGASQVLLTDDQVHNFLPVGWSTDGRLFYYATWSNLQKPWDLWSVDISNGLISFHFSAPDPQADGPLLSPNGDYVMFNFPEGEKRTLALLNLDDLQQQPVFSKVTGQEAISQYIAKWSPDNKEILLYLPPESDEASRLERLNLDSGQRHLVTEFGNGNEFFLPQSWSPDGEWLVILKYPYPQSLAYLMPTTGESMIQIPLTLPSNWFSFFGWANQAIELT